jgi:hypothetical protein
MALKATAAITWRSLVANAGILLAAIAVSLALGLEIGVQPGGLTGLIFTWSRPFGAYVAIAQLLATIWAVRRAVEITFISPPTRLSLYASVGATWSFAWRHFVAVFGVAALLYLPFYFSTAGPLQTPALAVLALWSFGPSFVWAVRGMLRAEAHRLASVGS